MGGSNVDLAQACQDRDEKKEDKSERAPLLRKASYTSSLDNIAIGGEEHEKVHLSCFSKEMGSNVDLVQVCQDHGEGKHEVKLEFEIEGSAVKENKEQEAVGTNWLPRRRKWMEKPPKDWKKSRRPSREDCP